MTRSRRRFKVLATHGFLAALDRLEREEASWGARATERLRSTLRDRNIPILERHPEVGRPFRSWNSLSAEGRLLVERVRLRLQGRELREYVTPEHLLLYVVSGRTVFLLSARHQRELAFPTPTVLAEDDRGLAPSGKKKPRKVPRKR